MANPGNTHTHAEYQLLTDVIQPELSHIARASINWYSTMENYLAEGTKAEHTHNHTCLAFPLLSLYPKEMCNMLLKAHTRIFTVVAVGTFRTGNYNANTHQ